MEVLFKLIVRVHATLEIRTNALTRVYILTLLVTIRKLNYVSPEIDPTVSKDALLIIMFPDKRTELRLKLKEEEVVVVTHLI